MKALKFLNTIFASKLRDIVEKDTCVERKDERTFAGRTGMVSPSMTTTTSDELEIAGKSVNSTITFGLSPEDKMSTVFCDRITKGDEG